MNDFGYRRLIVYQKSKALVKQVYALLKSFPNEERYALCDQLRRASISITSNIAEGVTRHSDKEKSHFIEMAFGSLMEVSSQLEIAFELGYMSEDDSTDFDATILEVAKLLSGLRNSYQQQFHS